MTSADLYYNIMVLKYGIEKDLLEDIQNVYLFIPYFYFDYDLSMSFLPVSHGRMMSFYQFDDWHNSNKKEDTNEYKVLSQMFAKKMMKFYKCRRKPVRKTCPVFNEEYFSFGLKRFGQSFPDTVDENISLLRDFLKYLKQCNIRFTIVVPPFYTQNIPEDYLVNIEKKKRIL